MPSQASGAAARAARSRAADRSAEPPVGALKRRHPAAYSSAVWAPVSAGPIVPGG